MGFTRRRASRGKSRFGLSKPPRQTDCGMGRPQTRNRPYAVSPLASVSTSTIGCAIQACWRSRRGGGPEGTTVFEKADRPLLREPKSRGQSSFNLTAPARLGCPQEEILKADTHGPWPKRHAWKLRTVGLTVGRARERQSRTPYPDAQPSRTRYNFAAISRVAGL